ncbi:MAG: hypothetical protein RLY14_281, partial [Planctomycetota bacterium]
MKQKNSDDLNDHRDCTTYLLRVSDAVNYREYWKFKNWPFLNAKGSQDFLAVASIVEADTRLQIVMQRGYQLALVLGPEGIGKTTFLKRLQANPTKFGVPNSAEIIRFSMAGFSLGDLPRTLSTHVNSTLSASFPNSATTHESAYAKCIQDWLLAANLRGIRQILILDDIHAAMSDVAVDVLRLIDAGSNLTILLSAATIPVGLVQQLLESRCQLRIDLPAWTLSETEQFIQHSIARAGGNPLIFSDQAIVRLHERSGGIPRQLI